MKLLLVLLIFIYGEVFAQPKGVPEYFSYPLSIDPRLNANFGEMRPNHFHMGLDLSTESRENLPVYAPADGFISRMKIETGGFGRAIYMDHPNGTTTLYAHMNRFIPAAENYLEDQQYVQQTWKIDLKVPAGLLPVKKGQLIGYSGNTGASQGPHVHFEIRDTETENCLNPLRFRFLLPDVTPPDVFDWFSMIEIKVFMNKHQLYTRSSKKAISIMLPTVWSYHLKKCSCLFKQQIE